MKEYLYYIAIGLLFFSKGIGLYDGTTAFKIFLVPALICLVLKIVMTSYRKAEYLMIAVLLAIGGGTYLISGEKGLLIYILLILGMKEIPIKKIFAVGLAAWGAAFSSLTLSSLFHLYDTPFKVHDKLGLGYIFRWGLGYIHPNVLHVSFLVLLFFITYVFQEHFNWKWYLAMFVMNCYIFLYSVSYAGFAMVCVYLLLQIYWTNRKKAGKIEKAFIYFVFPSCAFLSLAGPFLLKGKVYDIVDKVLNHRLILSEFFLVPENISLFGVRTEDLVTNNLTMDNAYVFAFITYGCVLFLGIFIIYELLLYNLVKYNKGTEIAMTITILGYGLVEPFLFNTSIKNLSVFFVGAYLWRELNSNPAEKSKLPDKMVKIWKRVIGAFTQKRLKVVTISLLAGCVCCIGYLRLTSLPEGYIVQRVECEVEGNTYKTFSQDDLKEHSNLKVIDYVDEDTPMEVFSGNIGRLELFRGGVSAFMLGAVGIGMLSTGLQARKDRL